jgi:hypothetical protein
LGGDDDDLKEVYDKLHNLNEFVDPEKFKSYDELQARLDKVLGNVHTERKKVDPELQEEIDDDYQEMVSSKSSKKSSIIEDDDDTTDEDDALDYFAKLSQM